MLEAKISAALEDLPQQNSAAKVDSRKLGSGDKLSSKKKGKKAMEASTKNGTSSSDRHCPTEVQSSPLDADGIEGPGDSGVDADLSTELRLFRRVPPGAPLIIRPGTIPNKCQLLFIIQCNAVTSLMLFHHWIYISYVNIM
jgi:hypothetical protein